MEGNGGGGDLFASLKPIRNLEEWNPPPLFLSSGECEGAAAQSVKIVRARHVAVRSDDVRSAAKDAPPPTVRMIQRHLDESPAPEGLLYDSGLADLPLLVRVRVRLWGTSVRESMRLRSNDDRRKGRAATRPAPPSRTP